MNSCGNEVPFLKCPKLIFFISKFKNGIKKKMDMQTINKNIWFA